MSCRLTFFLAVIGAFTGNAAAGARQAALFDELEILCPDSKVEAGVARLASATPRGVVAGVHLLVSGLTPGAELSWRLTEEGHDVLGTSFFRLVDVPVEQNTGRVSRTELWDKKENPYVVRRAPFRVYEALAPCAPPLTVPDNGTLALRIEVVVGRLAEAREHPFVIKLRSGSWTDDLDWALRVYPVACPQSSPESPGYTNWFSPRIIAERHGLEIWSEPFWTMLGRYADLMARGRQNTFWVRWGDMASMDEAGRLDFEAVRFARYLHIFLDRGFTRIEGGHLAGRHAADWGSPRLDFVLTGEDVTGAKGRAEIASLLGAVHEALVRQKLSDHITYLQHLSDEPTGTNAAAYKALAGDVRKALPGVKIFEATMSLELVGAIDCWCPQVQEYQKHRDFFEERKRAGEAVWVYTCLAPGGPWLNRLLDQERLRPLYFGWALARFDLSGFLHWGFNHYRPKQDPLQQSVVPHGKGPPNYLPAGDTHVVYPGREGPWSGQRFEAQRIGMEDAELLRLLKAKDPERAGAIIEQVFRAFDDYELEVSNYRSAKKALLEALSE